MSQNSRITTRMSPTSGLDGFGAAISFLMAARWPRVVVRSSVVNRGLESADHDGRGSPGEKDEKLGAAAGLAEIQAKNQALPERQRSGPGKESGSRLIPEPGSAGVLV